MNFRISRLVRLLTVSAILLAISGCVPVPPTGCLAPADIIDEPAEDVTVQVDCTVALHDTFVNVHVAGLDPFAEASVGFCGNRQWLRQGCGSVNVTADSQGVATTEVFVRSYVYHDDSPFDCTQGNCAIHVEQNDLIFGEGPALTVVSPS